MMKSFVFPAAAAIVVVTTPASANQIEQACVKSNRPAATREMCGCIQNVADLMLSKSDQKTAAKFFDDPQKAQKMRRSASLRNEKFWDRYESFGQSAQEFCSKF